MKILIFGGSFDPVHRGHLSIADQIQKEDEFDEVWFTPCQESRYGKVLTNWVDRTEMLKRAFRDFDNPTFRISMSEFECGAHGKMYKLATYLKGKHPDFEFEYLIGSDSLDNINSWYRSEELTKEFKFVIVPRDNDSVSSTAIREHVKLLGRSIMVTQSVNGYIKEKNLYV